MESEKSAGAQRGQRGSERGAFFLRSQGSRLPRLGKQKNLLQRNRKKVLQARRKSLNPSRNRMVPVGRHPKGRNRKTQGGTRLSQTLRKPRRMHRLDSLRRKNSRRKPRPTLSQKGKPRKPSPRTDLSNQGTPAGSIQLRSSPDMGARARGWMGNTPRSAALWISALWRISASALCWW